jgi:hypothetical protein
VCGAERNAPVETVGGSGSLRRPRRGDRLSALDKKLLSESDICDLFILPAIKGAGWDQITQIRREVTLAPGPVTVRGNVASRNKKKRKFADYVLYQEPGVPISVVEAKDNNHTVSQGLQQALGYADILDIPSAYSSNGDAFASHNKVPAAGEDIETQFPLDAFPAPALLWQRYKVYRGIKPRYYQSDAINRSIEAVAADRNRVLLVMATGTGKTYTTFQIIWRLWKAGAVKCALFLADRNILIDQALINDFKPFGGAMSVPDDFTEANISQHVAIIRAAFTGTETFLHYLVLSPYFQAFVFDEQTGAGRGGLPKNKMDRIAVALPPLAEQHRIVAKVGTLMGLCDRLEAARAEREAVRDKFTAASYARLNVLDPETFRDDARFALDALPALTTRPDQIRQIRQTILNLAVRGKLVPQDPADQFPDTLSGWSDGLCGSRLEGIRLSGSCMEQGRYRHASDYQQG